MSVCLSPIFSWKKGFRCERPESCADGDVSRKAFRFLREELAGAVFQEDLKGGELRSLPFARFFKMAVFKCFV